MRAVPLVAGVLGLASAGLGGYWGLERYQAREEVDLGALGAAVEAVVQGARSRALEAGRVQARIVLDYDDLAASSRVLEGLGAELRERIASIPASERHLVGGLRRLVFALAAQDEEVERYKTHFAAISGSRRYLPQAEASLRDLAEGLDAQARAATEPVRREAVELLLGVRAYEDSRSEELLRRLLERLRVFEANAPEVSGPLGIVLVDIGRHARVVLERSEDVRRGFDGLSADTVAEQAAVAAAAVERAQAERSVRDTFRNLAYGGAAATLGGAWIALLAVIAARRRRPREDAPAPAPAPAVAAEPVPGLAPAAFAALALERGLGSARIVGRPADLDPEVAGRVLECFSSLEGFALIAADALGRPVVSAHAPASRRPSEQALEDALAPVRATGASVTVHDQADYGTSVRIAADVLPSLPPEPENLHG